MPVTAVLVAGGAIAAGAVVVATSKKNPGGTPYSGRPDAIIQNGVAVDGIVNKTSGWQPGLQAVGLTGGASRIKFPLAVSKAEGTASELQVLREAERRAKAEYDKLEAKAKKAGAKKLNKELGTSLDGTESWQEASAEVGAAVGGTAGGAVGAAFGGPAGAVIGAYIGAMAGAYLGKKLGDLYDAAWGEVEDWAASQYKGAKKKLKKGAKKALGDTWNWLEDQL